MKTCGLFAAVLLFALATPAADAPRVEVFGGYSYVRMTDHGSADLNGGSASISLNPNRWLGLVADIGGYHGGDNGLKGDVVTYLFGPKIALHSGRITPFVQGLFGGAYNTADPPPSLGSLARLEGALAGGGGQFASSNSFAMAVGGGLDVNATKHLGVRLIQAEYLMTKFKDGINDRQDSARISAGLVFRF